MPSSKLRQIALLILIFSFAGSALAQFTTARLSGTVSDPSGAVVRAQQSPRRILGPDIPAPQLAHPPASICFPACR